MQVLKAFAHPTENICRPMGDFQLENKKYFPKHNLFNVYFRNMLIFYGEELLGMGEKRNAYKIFLGKSEEMRPLGRPRRRWVDNIKMDFGEMEWYGLD
jgi:hypothetical protein